jgi:alpha-beta hydrolase superfamily lysophospholipase
MRQLALRLSRLGFHVVRFDYFATGNSSGLSQQLSLQTCVQNIVDIGQFIVENSNSEKLTYIGLRLGAALASISSTKQPPDHLILWDPVLSGKTFLTESAVMHKNILAKMKRAESHNHKLGREYLGYPYSDDLIAELNQIQLDNIDLPINSALSILTSPDNKEHDQLIEKIRNSRPLFQYEETTKWPVKSEDIRTLDSSFLPSQSINQICKFLKASQ